MKAVKQLGVFWGIINEPPPQERKEKLESNRGSNGCLTWYVILLQGASIIPRSTLRRPAAPGLYLS